MSALHNVSIFQSLTEEDPALLESHGRRRRYDKNFIVVQEGDEGSSMSVILTGRVSVYTANADGKRLWLRDMVAGDYFGEYALLDDSPRSATIHTAEPSEFLEISRDAVLQTFAQKPRRRLRTDPGSGRTDSGPHASREGACARELRRQGGLRAAVRLGA